MATSGGSGSANNAAVRTGTASPGDAERARVALAEAEAAVEAIERKMAGWKETHAAAKARVREARAQLKESGDGVG